ncbi:unnamed protein product [Chrysodeixis includens]|uniref:Metalloendopeptidase n=1 Tax=Chrysodeixis includens TaxID=689277 RepID=A0A9P0BYV7_CHRIL|nr:unnamed protein product [Chrysodeixis includens]
MGRIKLSVVLIVVCVVKCLAMTYDELEDFAEHLKKTSQLSPTLKKGVNPDDDYDDDEEVSDHAWEESGKFEGDLILNERQRRLIVEDVAEGLSRNGITDGTKRWPNNEVTYYIQVEHFTSDQVQAIESGIEDLARASCVKFRPYKKGDRDAVVIQGSRRGCFSQVGYQGGYQVLNLSGRHPVGRGCFRHGTVVHELLHTLGFYHMQSSPDRDDYVDIVWANIVQPARHNFRKYNSFSVSDFGVGYDYDSVLHYSRRAFSSNGQDTIVPKQAGAQIGQRTGLSDKDTQKLNKMYCDGDVDNSPADESSTSKTKNKKKRVKNKPFQGQGIGYHQGKAVAIKLLPAAETYKLRDVPSFHVFDYFSKEPQIMPTSENEGFRIGKEIAYTYMPPEPLTIPNYNMPQSYNIEPEVKLYGSDKSLMLYNGEEAKQAKHPNNKMLRPHKTTSVEPLRDYDGPETEPNDPFERLSKILKLHVYPSQTPDLRIYKEDAPYSSYYESHGLKKENDKLTSPEPNESDRYEKDKVNSAMKFIDSLHGFHSDKSDLGVPHTEKHDKYKIEKKKSNKEHSFGLEYDDTDKHTPAYTIPPSLNKKYEDEYDARLGFDFPEYYQDKLKYSQFPKSQDKKKSEKGQNDWYHDYTPFYSDHDPYYHDYSKDSSREASYDEKPNENISSSSTAVRTQQYSIFPAQRPTNWYTSGR